MKSSFVFKPRLDGANGKTLVEWVYLLTSCDLLANAVNKEVRLTMQHSLKTDEFAVLVELPRETFSYHDKNPRKVVRKVESLLSKRIEKENNANEKKERTAGAKSRGGRGRKSSTGKRGSSVLQKRRS